MIPPQTPPPLPPKEWTAAYRMLEEARQRGWNLAEFVDRRIALAKSALDALVAECPGKVFFSNAQMPGFIYLSLSGYGGPTIESVRPFRFMPYRNVRKDEFLAAELANCGLSLNRKRDMLAEAMKRVRQIMG